MHHLHYHGNKRWDHFPDRPVFRTNIILCASLLQYMIVCYQLIIPICNLDHTGEAALEIST